MATIKFVNGKDRNFTSVEERAKTDPQLAEAMKHFPPGEGNGDLFTHHSGSSDEPQLLEVRFPANNKVEAHAHDADEILVVTEGEIHFGKQVYGVGSSVFIPKMTLYSFQAGPNGLTFLNFRPTKSHGAIFKDTFMEMRRREDHTSN
jgi:mannose-6-phosphate isomerase-like protein (cupin superfamily)